MIQPKQKKRMGPWQLVLLMLLSTVLAERILRLVYSVFDSDVLYRDTVIPALFSYAAEIVGVLFLSVSVAAVAYMTKYHSWKSGVVMLLMALAVLSLLPLSGWIIDITTHNFYGFEMEVLVASFLREESKPIPLFLALLFGILARRTKKISVSLVIIFSAVLYSIILLMPVGYRIVIFFREYNYPTADEISSMIQEVVNPLFFYGILLGGGALLFVPFLEKKEDVSV